MNVCLGPGEGKKRQQQVEEKEGLVRQEGR